MTTAVGVVHFGDDGTLRVVLVVTPEHTDRVKCVAETPCSREHHHAGRGNSPFLQEAPYVHMVLLPDPGTPPNDPSRIGKRIEIDKPVRRPIPKAVHER